MKIDLQANIPRIILIGEFEKSGGIFKSNTPGCKLWIGYSYDQVNYTQFSEIDSDGDIVLDFPLYPVYVRIKVLSAESVTFDYKVTYPEKEIEKIEQNTMLALEFVHSPYDVAQMGKDIKFMERDVNYWLNNVGIEVDYIHTNPDMDSHDKFLNEYSINNVVGIKPIKVVCKDNTTPEPKHEYTQWGIEFEKLDIHIEKSYFEEQFGVGEIPRNKDYMYFRELNRMYIIKDTYLSHGINENGTYWICTLKKYEDNKTTVGGDAYQSDMDEINEMMNFPEITDEMYSEIIDVTKPQQHIQNNSNNDRLRDEFRVGIVENEMLVNRTILSKYQYRMQDSLISYRNHIITSGGLCLMFWVKGNPSDMFKYSGKNLLKYSNSEFIMDDIAIPFELMDGVYNGIVLSLNFQNNFGTLTNYNLDKTVYDHKTFNIDGKNFEQKIQDSKLELTGSGFDIFNIRLARMSMTHEYHPMFMFNQKVERESAFIIIDNNLPNEHSWHITKPKV